MGSKKKQELGPGDTLWEFRTSPDRRLFIVAPTWFMARQIAHINLGGDLGAMTWKAHKGLHAT